MSGSDVLAEDAKHQGCAMNEQASSGQKESTAATSMSRSWSSESFTNTGVKTCVCAPTTHAGSFRCRLHRMTHHVQAHAVPIRPPAAASRSSTSQRTVEAQ